MNSSRRIIYYFNVWRRHLPSQYRGFRDFNLIGLVNHNLCFNCGNQSLVFLVSPSRNTYNVTTCNNLNRYLLLTVPLPKVNFVKKWE